MFVHPKTSLASASARPSTFARSTLSGARNRVKTVARKRGLESMGCLEVLLSLSSWSGSTEAVPSDLGSRAELVEELAPSILEPRDDLEEDQLAIEERIQLVEVSTSQIASADTSSRFGTPTSTPEVAPSPSDIHEASSLAPAMANQTNDVERVKGGKRSQAENGEAGTSTSPRPMTSFAGRCNFLILPLSSSSFF